MEQRTTAQPMQRPTLQQMLATISPLMLDQTVGDAHLAGIATALANWRSVCTNLGISAAEEAAIEEENQTADTRRYVELIMMCVFAPICPCCSALSGSLLGKWKTLKYGNGSTEVRRKVAYRCLVHECAL